MSSPGYESYLESLQRLRASVYLRDGAIQACQIDAKGRYRMQSDEEAWHLLLLDSAEQVAGCARYLLHGTKMSYSDLGLSQTALAQDPHWGPKLRRAVEADLKWALRQGLAYAELGGWAIAEEYRNTRAALEVVLGSYVWAELVGGCICSCAATVRHGSSSILRRIGGHSFLDKSDELPPYFDPRYRCQMELLRFDSREVPPRFLRAAAEVKRKLAERPAVQRSSSPDERGVITDLAALQAAIGKSVPTHSAQFTLVF